LRDFFRQRITLTDAQAILRQQIVHIYSNFSRLMERGVTVDARLRLMGWPNLCAMCAALANKPVKGLPLVGSLMLHILEAVLPAHFGGNPLDYQLLEEEDQQGFNRLSRLVSPKIQIKDEIHPFETVLQALKRSSTAAHLGGELWKRAETLVIVRREPIWTKGTKFITLHRTKLAPQLTNNE
jgi:hypothetical protein